MGLCKCPHRKVTNLFCFEHKVNVCENCLVTTHVRCVVKSYLQWLQDSDFDSLCRICQDSLDVGDVIRLLCYDVLHSSCAEKFLLAYPAHTAPDGFFCPACHAPFMPPENAASPVADALKRGLDAMPDLQKRLHSLSATSITCQKISPPPTSSRPEPEGTEVPNDQLIPTEPQALTQTSRIETTIESPASSPWKTAAPSVTESPGKVSTEEESSSASDFIATNASSFSSTWPENRRQVIPPPSPLPLKTEVANVGVGALSTPTSFHAADGIHRHGSVLLDIEASDKPTHRTPSATPSYATPAFSTAASSPGVSAVSTSFENQVLASRESSYIPPPLSYTEKSPGPSSRSSGLNRSHVADAVVPISAKVPSKADDHDEHKYRPKPLMEMIRTWLKIFSPPRHRRSPPSVWRRFVILVLIGFMCIVVLALLFHRLGRGGDDGFEDDPLLDLKANPFVKYENQ